MDEDGEVSRRGGRAAGGVAVVVLVDRVRAGGVEFEFGGWEVGGGREEDGRG